MLFAEAGRSSAGKHACCARVEACETPSPEKCCRSAYERSLTTTPAKLCRVLFRPLALH